MCSSLCCSHTSPTNEVLKKISPKSVTKQIHPVVIAQPESKEKLTDEAFALNEGLLSVKTLKKNYILKKLPGIKEEPFMGSIKA